jgi:hypothetical protein
MNKSTIIFLITFFATIFLSNIDVQGQDYGTTNWYDELSATNKDGFKPPLSKKEEKIRGKAKRLSLTHKDVQVLNLKERGKELTFKQKIRYPFAKRKKTKLDKLQKEADKMNGSSNTTNEPGYFEADNEYQLTIEEKELMKKAEQDSASLTKKELKILKKADKKEKKREKQEAKNREKFTPIELTPEEENLLIKEKKQKDSLTNEDKKQIKEINKKVKHNKKVKDNVHQYFVDSAYATGGYMPVQQKKFRLPRFSFKKKKKHRPSKFLKKIRRVEKKYGPSRSYQRVMAKKADDRKITARDQRILLKYRKNKDTNDWILRQKMQKIYRKEFKKNQLKSTRKMMRKTRRDSEKLQKGRKKYLRKTKFLKLFKKKK